MRRCLIVLFLTLLFSLVAMVNGGAASASTNFCVGDNVVPGGVNGASDVALAYSHPRVTHVYQYFGISQQDVNSLGSQSLRGTVTKSGKVIVHGKVVATHAISAGCGFIAGSTKVNDGYMIFYTRPTSVSFAKPSLSAMVMMKDNEFAFAVLNSCGNPVMASPLKPKKTPVAVAIAPTQTQAQTQTVVINNTQPRVKAAQTTAPAQATTSLPNTGPGDVLGISSVAAVIGTAGHYLYNRRRRY